VRAGARPREPPASARPLDFSGRPATSRRRSAHQGRHVPSAAHGLVKGDIPCSSRPGPIRGPGASPRASPSPVRRSALTTRGRLEVARGSHRHEVRDAGFHVYVEQSASCVRGNLALSVLIKLIQINSVSGTPPGVPEHHARRVSPPSARFRALTHVGDLEHLFRLAQAANTLGVCLLTSLNYHI